MCKVFLKVLFCMSLFISCKQEVEPKFDTTKQQQTEEIVESVLTEQELKLQKFYEYLLLGKNDKALAQVNEISLVEQDFAIQEKTYDALFKEFSLDKTFYEASKFTELDLFYWVQSLFFKKQVNKVVQSLKKDQDPIKALYDLVNERVKDKGPSSDKGAFPLHIWQRAFGVCDRQSWVMCELAYQLGADVYIIYFVEEDTGISKHTICQISYQGRQYLIDPLYKKFLADVHWNDLDEEKAAKIWSEHPYLADDIKKAEILLPSMPHDFSRRQQVLAKKLQKIIPKDILFRFGEDPKLRSARWPYLTGQDYFYWDYPHRLMTGMFIYRKLYPEKNEVK
ncbi:hypothetical protein PQO03_09425 [Lentisphaera profundi]|uniref:Transglutaminase-like domain-containing protein n=1 Tax=Lentisphaera profundi TaxID=1658616 RepID=A0ABY7VT24_9BACT|nr:hypothetical protein [Lentisphaera profundi]WDE95934.1 hypothetical protein PQO03_09425 [Lentisphaera profundi]